MGVNTLDDDDFGLGELGRLAEQNEREPAAFRELRLRARKAKKGVNFWGARIEDTENFPSAAKEYAKHVNTIQQLRPRMALYKESMRERLNAQAVNTIGREFSETRVGSYVSAHINSIESQVAGMAMANQPYANLAQQRDAIMSQMGGLRQESMAAASEYIQNRGINSSANATIQANAGQMKDLANQLIPITIAMQQLKQQGLDPQGRKRDLISTGDKAAGVLAYNRLEEEMRSGKGLGALSDADLRKKESEAANKLIKALEELRNAAGKTKDELDGLNKNAEEASKEFKDMQEARRIGGNDNNGYQAGAAWASAVAQLANLVGNTIQTMGINQPMQVMGNIGGYAGLENQKYDMWRSAVGGNMTDRLNLAGWKNAAEFGRSMATTAGWVVGSRVVGGVAAGTAGGLQLADAISSAPGGVASSKLLGNAQTVQNIASGGLALGEGVSMTAIAGKDAWQKISTSQAEIEGNLAAMAATKQLTHIPGYQLQQYRDYMMGLNAAAMGIGGAGAANFLDAAGGRGFMGRMARVGVGLGELGQLAQFGVQNMGSTFTADMALRSKDYENFGLGSAQDNMRRAAIFAGAGSQNPMQSLEKTLERAVGNGFQSSKALNLIAENTGQLVEQNSARGGLFDITDTLNRLVLGATDRNNPNKEFAIKHAFEAFKTNEDYATNTSSSFAGQFAVARLQKNLGLDLESSILLQKTSTGMIQDWASRTKNGDIAGVIRDAAGQGLDLGSNALFKRDPNKFFSILGRDKMDTIVERAGPGWATGANQNWASIRAWLENDPTGEHQKMFTNETSLEGAPANIRSGIMAMRRSIGLAPGNQNISQAMRDLLSRMGMGTSGSTPLPQEGAQRPDAYGFSQEERNRAGVQQNAAAQQGVSTIAGQNYNGTTAFMAVNATGRIAQGQQSSEAAWAQAAAESAKTFGESAIKLDQASGKLVEAAEKLIAFAGANRLSGPDPLIEKTKRELDKHYPKFPNGQTQKADGGSP